MLSVTKSFTENFQSTFNILEKEKEGYYIMYIVFASCLHPCACKQIHISIYTERWLSNYIHNAFHMLNDSRTYNLAGVYLYNIL